MEARVKLKPMQPGDIKKTYADINKAQKCSIIIHPKNSKVNLGKFIDWYSSYYSI